MSSGSIPALSVLRHGDLLSVYIVMFLAFTGLLFQLVNLQVLERVRLTESALLTITPMKSVCLLRAGSFMTAMDISLRVILLPIM